MAGPVRPEYEVKSGEDSPPLESAAEAAEVPARVPPYLFAPTQWYMTRREETSTWACPQCDHTWEVTNPERVEEPEARTQARVPAPTHVADEAASAAAAAMVERFHCDVSKLPTC